MTAGATLPNPPPAGQLRRAGIRDDEFRVVAPSQTWWRVHRIEAAFVLAWHEFRCYGPVLRFAPTPRGPLDGLLAIAILATAAGMVLRRVRDLGGYRADRVLAQLGIRFRRPTEKTFRAVFQQLDPADLDRRLGAYFNALAATEAAAEGRLLAVALDGKTLRGARRAGAAAAHLVSVFAHHARLVLGQLAVAQKSNEIPCVRKILHPFRQVRLLVTVDALCRYRHKDVLCRGGCYADMAVIALVRAVLGVLISA